MPGSTLPGDHTASLTKTIARVERLERKTEPRTVGATPERILFSYAGPLALTESPPWYPSRGGTITLVRVSLLANATGTNTVAVRVNGTTIQSFSVTSGLKTVQSAAAIPISPLDYVSVLLTAAVDGDMTVTMDMT
jgi:hypothetical protein